MPDRLTEARLRMALGARPFQFYAQTESTNDLARDWAVHGAAAGSVIVTEEQTAGRGRFARVWHAPPGSALLFSVIVRPYALTHTPGADLAGRVTMLGAVAVAEQIAALDDHDAANRRITIKWPNDVQLDGRKVAGILPEAIWQGDQALAVVLGIGLNVRIDFAGTALSDAAISLEPHLTGSVDRAALLAGLLRRIDAWAIHLTEPDLLAAWRTRLSTLGQRVTARAADGRIISGRASDVDADGALLLTADDGTQQRIIAGEVTLNKME